MGQQQLLLLVLGIVIVGLAVVVGIQAFGENQKKANADALTNDGVRIASDAQAWKLKPAAFGGGADKSGFDGLSLAQLGYTQEVAKGLDEDIDAGTAATPDTTYYQNLNGQWQVTDASATKFEFVGCNEASGNEVTVTVTGTTSKEIATDVVTNSGCEYVGD